MELHPGIFVSRLATEEWEPDAEVGGEMHVLCAGLELEAGLSRFPPGGDQPIHWTLPARETLLVLEGHARIEIAGGPTLDLSTGDMASLPKGAVRGWHLKLPFKEMWVLAGA